MRIVFMGTGEIALPALEWLVSRRSASADAEVVAVYTGPDKPVGRKQVLTPPGIKVLAERSGIPVRQPETFRGDDGEIEEFAALRPDLAVVMAYGQILPSKLIAIPSLACVNLHASLLPRHRGASPIQAAIREGDAETGITLMHIAPKLDGGDMILDESIPILPWDTAGTLHDRLARLAPLVLEKGWESLVSGGKAATPQDEALVSYSGKLGREDGEIDWTSDAASLERLLRAYDPWPGTTTSFPHGGERRKLKIHPFATTTEGAASPPGTVLENRSRLVVNCGLGALVLEGDLQIEGRRRLPVDDFLRGVDLPIGTILGEG